MSISLATARTNAITIIAAVAVFFLIVGVSGRADAQVYQLSNGVQCTMYTDGLCRDAYGNAYSFQQQQVQRTTTYTRTTYGASAGYQASANTGNRQCRFDVWEQVNTCNCSGNDEIEFRAPGTTNFGFFKTSGMVRTNRSQATEQRCTRQRESSSNDNRTAQAFSPAPSAPAAPAPAPAPADPPHAADPTDPTVSF